MPTTHVDPNNWDEKVLGSTVPVIVDFWAPWCPWCRRLMPEFDSLSDEYTGRLDFVKVNAGDAPDIASTYGIQGLPTLKFFCASRPIAEIVGHMPKAPLKMRLDRMLAMHKDCLDQSSALKH